jgi:hypothetical protein
MGSEPAAPRRVPAWVWISLPAVGLVGGIVAPLVWESRNVPYALTPEGAQLTPEVEAQLSCAVEQACGPLKGEVTLELAHAPELVPADVMPPGYAECAADRLGTAFGQEIRLTPCKGK